MNERDRDSRGRARNARPRDELGRPLERDASGVPGVPDDLALSPSESIDEAQRLLDTQRPFHAHEVLEATWKASPQEERDLWRGLAQLAVGLTHAQRGNATGAVALLRRAANRIGPWADARPHSLDVTGVRTYAEELAHLIESNGIPDEIAPPKLAG